MKYSEGRSFRSARCSCSATEGLPFLASPRPMRSAAGENSLFSVSRMPCDWGRACEPAVVTPYAARRAWKSSEPPAARRIWLMPRKKRNTPAKAISPKTTVMLIYSSNKSVQLIRRRLARRRKKLLWNVFPFRPEVLHAHGKNAGGGVVANRLALRVDANLPEYVKLLHLDFTLLADADDLGHADDATDTAAEA